MNTNYNNNVAGALKLITVNGSVYQLGKDASNLEGGIAKLFGGSGAFESYKTSTDGAYDAKTIYDEIKAINDAIGAGGENSIADQVSDIQDAIGEGFDSSNTVADAIAEAKTVVAQAANDYITVTETAGADGHAIYTIGTSGIDGAIEGAVAAVVDGADAAFDTLKEIADWIQADQTGAAAILADVANKANKVAMSGNGAATQGNFFSISATGDLADSGYNASSFVAAESGKRLMTDAEGTKLSGIATGAEVNVIEGVKINGTAGSITNKIADLGSNFVQDASYVHTDNNYTTAEKNKLAAITATVSSDTLTITTVAPAA